MALDNNTERQFSEYLDKLLTGEDVSVSSEASDELKEAVEFARTLMTLSSQPSPAFQTALKMRLINKLVEREEQAREVKKWWQFGPSTRWVSIAATAAVVFLAVVGFLGYRGIFSQLPASTPPAAPSASPTPTTPTTPATPSAPSAPSAQKPPTIEAPQKESASPRPPQKTGGNVQIDYAFGFNNLSDLTAFSDAIAVAVVDRAVEVTRQNGPYSTRWALRVEKTLKGAQLSRLSVSQTGSPDVPGSDGSEDPVFVPGERYLLFLRESAPGQYFYFGPNGRYLIWNDKVYSMNHVIVGAGGYQAPPELNFAGLSLYTFTANINKLVDSVQLIFTQGKASVQTDVLRYPAGTTLTIDARLSSGEHGPARVTMAIDKTGIPDGLEVSLQPVEFVAYPRNVYSSNLTIAIAPNLLPGSYQIPVEYDFDGVVRGRRVITLHVEPR